MLIARSLALISFLAGARFVLANKRVAIDFNQWALKDAGYPDGMCIDQEGKLWIAGFFSSKIMQFDPITGKCFTTSITALSPFLCIQILRRAFPSN